MTLGEFIRFKRFQKRITQASLAEKTQMRQYEICLLERHNYPIPSNIKLSLIATEFGINPDILFLMAGKSPTKIQEWLLSDPDRNSEKCLKFLTMVEAR
jgi:transcriptional regulator with XRE-family HTH domain